MDIAPLKWAAACEQMVMGYLLRAVPLRKLPRNARQQLHSLLGEWPSVLGCGSAPPDEPVVRAFQLLWLTQRVEDCLREPVAPGAVQETCDLLTSMLKEFKACTSPHQWSWLANIMERWLQQSLLSVLDVCSVSLPSVLTSIAAEDAWLTPAAKTLFYTVIRRAFDVHVRLLLRNERAFTYQWPEAQAWFSMLVQVVNSGLAGGRCRYAGLPRPLKLVPHGVVARKLRRLLTSMSYDTQSEGTVWAVLDMAANHSRLCKDQDIAGSVWTMIKRMKASDDGLGFQAAHEVDRPVWRKPQTWNLHGYFHGALRPHCSPTTLDRIHAAVRAYVARPVYACSSCGARRLCFLGALGSQ